MPCIIKYEYEDGIKLPPHKQVLWCGRANDGFTWSFTDAQHAALSDKPVCNKCRGNIIKALRRKED